MLSPRDKPVVINVKGPSELRSSAVESLRVQIDGIPFPLPVNVTGAMYVALPDTFTTPPAPAPVAAPVVDAIHARYQLIGDILRAALLLPRPLWNNARMS